MSNIGGFLALVSFQVGAPKKRRFDAAGGEFRSHRPSVKIHGRTGPFRSKILRGFANEGYAEFAADDPDNHNFSGSLAEKEMAEHFEVLYHVLCLNNRNKSPQIFKKSPPQIQPKNTKQKNHQEISNMRIYDDSNILDALEYFFFPFVGSLRQWLADSCAISWPRALVAWIRSVEGWFWGPKNWPKEISLGERNRFRLLPRKRTAGTWKGISSSKPPFWGSSH